MKKCLGGDGKGWNLEHSLRKQKGLLFFRARGMTVGASNGRILNANKFVGEWEELREVMVDSFYSFCKVKAKWQDHFFKKESDCMGVEGQRETLANQA